MDEISFSQDFLLVKKLQELENNTASMSTNANSKQRPLFSKFICY